MFTGIVEAIATVEEVARDGASLRLYLRVADEIGRDLALGDSLAVSGVCLTVTERAPARLGFDLAEETRRVTTLGDLRPEDRVNLERPLRLGARLGGHLVLGHADGVGRVAAVSPEGAGRRLAIAAPPALRPFLISRGSVAVDGVSLTIAGLSDEGFSVALIPHTLTATTLGQATEGARVNLEVDVIGKYVRAFLPAGEAAREFLARHDMLPTP